ncbi:Uma2 family endonuclease [Polyangium aurulentum]|uniref:Uma2 family endonuclease n=1 Tax=Polyangium aurulentum TaxID=2567896 RepID=UPI0010AE6311|nr:Uma2 family endonuclease [Polyangium aurulentum]UQA57325.1 Uma2 family endonuclease [Polyangium aurulentum]
MTLEAWAELDEDEPGELVDGWLVEEEVASHPHEVVVSWLIRTLGNWMEPRRGIVLGSEHKLAVAPARGRKPDVTMYPPGTRLGRGSLSRKPPVLVVEVLSPRPRDVRRDREEKPVDYAQLGIRNYWLVDPEARLFEMYRLDSEGSYTLALSAPAGQVSVPGCEGLVLDLDALWARVEELGEDDDPEEDEAAESGET